MLLYLQLAPLLKTKFRHMCCIANLQNVSACNFIRNLTLTQTFSVNFPNIFRLELFQKLDSGIGDFLWLLRNFLASSVTKNEISKVFSCKFWEVFQLAAILITRLCHRCFVLSFCKIFKRTYFVDHLRTAASNIWLFARLI